MQKTTGIQTATTFTLAESHPNFRSMDAADLAGFCKPYVWPSADQARKTVTRMIESNGFEYTRHTAPGLEVFAFYVNGARITVIAFEDKDAKRIAKAADREQPVTITYTKADGTETVRTIEPTGLKLTKAGDTLIVAMDRLSGEKRSFRLDRVSAYTVHRTRRTVRTEAPAPSKAELVAAFQAHTTPLSATDPRPVVRITTNGWTGRIVRGTRKFGPSGWSVIVELSLPYAHHTPSGTVRVLDGDLVTLTEERQAQHATV